MLPDFVEYFLKPSSYDVYGESDKTKEVSLIQTHISYIVLTDNFVYKIKKPVDFGFLDFTTLEKRRHFLEEELRLNKRLTNDIYIEVLGIYRNDSGGFVFKEDLDGVGIVDFALKMVRLSEDTILENLIKDNLVTPEMMELVTGRIFFFHKDAPGDKDGDDHISSFGAVDKVRLNFEDSFDQTESHIGYTITRERFDSLREKQKEFFDSHGDLFEERVKGGFIRECHGDMHSENISIGRGKTEGVINIFDCIEFNERFRYIDVVSDLAFLLMDLDFLNRSDLSKLVEEKYFKLSRGDGAGGRKLLKIYKAYRAYVRGKVEGLTARDKNIGDALRQEARLKAIRYFDLCEDYLSETKQPKCIITAGLSGSGKSHWARKIKDETNFVHLSSDVIRKELFHVAIDKENPDLSIYSKEASDKTYSELLGRALLEIIRGKSVIMDATFINEKSFIECTTEMERSGAEVTAFLFTADDDTVKKRLEERYSGGDFVSDADWSVYLKQKEKFKGFHIPHIEIDSTEEENIIMEKIIKEIFY